MPRCTRVYSGTNRVPSGIMDGRNEKPFGSLTVDRDPGHRTVLEKLSPGDYNDVKNTVFKPRSGTFHIIASIVNSYCSSQSL